MPIILRSEKGEPLTHGEMDGNFILLRELLEGQSRIVIPGTTFSPADTSNPFSFGATNGETAHTMQSMYFQSGLTGQISCGLMVQLPTSFGEKELNVYFLAASHASSLPFPNNVRLMFDIYPLQSGNGSIQTTLTINHAQGVSNEQLIGTVTLFANAQLNVSLIRDYDHADDDGGNMFFVWMAFERTDGGGALAASSFSPLMVSAAPGVEEESGEEPSKIKTLSAPKRKQELGKKIQSVESQINTLRAKREHKE